MGTAKLMIKYTLTSIDGEEPGFTPIQLISTLTHLPPHTKVIGFEELPQTALSRDFYILLSNPMFLDTREILEIDYQNLVTRELAFNEKGELIQFNRMSALNLDKVLRKRQPLVAVEPQVDDSVALLRSSKPNMKIAQIEPNLPLDKPDLDVKEIEELQKRLRLGSFALDKETIAPPDENPITKEMAKQNSGLDIEEIKAVREAIRLGTFSAKEE